MKVLIWVGCFLAATILNTLLGFVTGIKIGYLLFYLGVYFAAKKLCEMWDEHLENKKRKNEVAPELPRPAGWQCVCGKDHAAYETSCVCGKSKFDVMAQRKPTAPQKKEKVRFCRKCGEELIAQSRFCRVCGTQVVEITLDQ